MNEAIETPEVDTDEDVPTLRGFAPRWWRLSPEDEGHDEVQIVDSLALFSVRLKAYGRLLGDSDELDHETIAEVGDMLADLANEMEAFKTLIDARRLARREAAKARAGRKS